MIEQVDDYRILQYLDEGSQGKVFLAWETSLERKVVLKTLSNSKDYNLLEEAKIAASVEHPNIVRIYRLGKGSDFYYMVMEYVEGISLDRCMDSFDKTKVWNIALQTIDALNALQEKGIIHLDVKPSNLMITANETCKLLDFGIAKKKENKSNIFRGTPYYMSPEQAHLEEVDFRSDMYSLGATLYHLFTGEPMFTEGSFMSLAAMHRLDLIKFPEEAIKNKFITEKGTWILAKMLQKSPEDRYGNYQDLKDDILHIIRDSSFPKNATKKDALKLYQDYEDKKSSWTSSFSNLLRITSPITSQNMPSEDVNHESNTGITSSKHSQLEKTIDLVMEKEVDEIIANFSASFGILDEVFLEMMKKSAKLKTILNLWVNDKEPQESIIDFLERKKILISGAREIILSVKKGYLKLDAVEFLLSKNADEEKS